MSGKETAPRARPCPICGALSVARYYPFCSKRCADIDLHRWLSEGYAIPATEDDDTIDPDDAAERS